MKMATHPQPHETRRHEACHPSAGTAQPLPSTMYGPGAGVSGVSSAVPPTSYGGGYFPTTGGPTMQWGGFNPTTQFGYGGGGYGAHTGGYSGFPKTGADYPVKFPDSGFGDVGASYYPPWSRDFGNVFEPEPWATSTMPAYGYRSWPTGTSNIPGGMSGFGSSSMNPAWYDSWNNFINRSSMDPTTGGLYNVNFRPNNWIEFYTLTNPIRNLDRDGNRMLFLGFDLRGFKPEEISVTLHKGDRSILVEAIAEYKDPKEHQMMRKYSRKFVLPESLKSIDVSKLELHSALNVNGMLTIEAVLPKMTPDELARWTRETSHSHTGHGVGATYYPIGCRPVTNA